MINFKSVKIQWLGHAGFLLTNSANQKVCIDPFQVEGSSYDPVDIVISTHEHGDHCSIDDINKFISPETEVIGIPMAKEQLTTLDCKTVHYVKPGDNLTVKGIEFNIVPAYNLNKFRSEGVPFHPKEDRKIGVVIHLDGHKVYNAGDTDNIPEMSSSPPSKWYLCNDCSRGPRSYENFTTQIGSAHAFWSNCWRSIYGRKI